jgi:hypothetical protein
VKGNFHARLLGGKEAVKSLTYPTIFNAAEVANAVVLTAKHVFGEK